MINNNHQNDSNQSDNSQTEKSIPEITLAVPWVSTSNISQSCRVVNTASGASGTSGDFNFNTITGKVKSENDSNNVQDNFIKERTRLHEIYIREEFRNKRIGLILSFILILAAAVIVMFAPKGREKMSYWVGSSLVIFAASAGGFGRFWAKAASISFGADQDKRSM